MHTIEDIKLLVSEVVTNAVRHPGRVRPHRDEGDARGAARCASRWSTPAARGFAKPRVSTPPPDALGGRGLLIVDRVATRWGVDEGTPTRVWFELAAA